MANEEQKTNENNNHSLTKPEHPERYDWLEVKFLFGFFPGAIAYILIARIIVNQTTLGCYQTGFARNMIEATMLPAGILLGLIDFPSQRPHELVKYAISSLPYAILGGLISSGLRRIALYLLILLIICFCLSLFLWIMFSAQICA